MSSVRSILHRATTMYRTVRDDIEALFSAPKPLDRMIPSKPRQAPAPLSAVPKPSSRAGVLIIGDSLTAGMKPKITAQMVGAPLQVDGRPGRPLEEGMAIYNAVEVKPRVVEMGLFTNNDPASWHVQYELRPAIQKTIDDARSRGGRVVWATIASDQNYDEANELIHQMARDNPDVMRVVEWADAVRADPSLVAADKYKKHPDERGYQLRAALFAAAARD